MTDNFEFSLRENTLEKILSLKTKMGFDGKGWDEWFDYVLSSIHVEKTANQGLEEIMERVYYDKFYEGWVKNFALNLTDIWIEPSARALVPTNDPDYKAEEHSVIVIGKGPSIKKHKHLELLANSNYKGAIVCCDGAIVDALRAGVTPEKFQQYYVVTIDGMEIIKKYYDDDIIDKYGKKIKGIFSTVTHPLVTARAREAGIKIHWLHALFDYHEGKKSFNQISALMVRAKNHLNGLPAIQTGGNTGTASWFISWQILKRFVVSLIGINHSWDEDDAWELITSHCTIAGTSIDRKNPIFKKLFPKIYNPEFNCNCILDPLFLYYSNALKEFISRSPSHVTTINATEGGCIFGDRIKCLTFKDFLANYEK
jgi:hypothetical protein